MAWRIEYSRSAERKLAKLDARLARRILDFMDRRIAVTSNPRASGQALTGALSGLWRYRVGDYRLICEIRDSEIMILVIEIGDRKDVYR